MSSSGTTTSASGTLSAGIEERYAPSGDVSMASVERVAEAPLVEGGDDLVHAVGDGHRGLEAEDAGHLVECDLVVARILFAMHVRDRPAFDPAADDVHDVELAVVLVGPPNVEHLARDILLGRIEREPDRPGRVAHVHVGPPEALAEHLEAAVRPQVTSELVHRQIEAHARR